jgi:hypothetical protein
MVEVVAILCSSTSSFSPSPEPPRIRICIRLPMLFSQAVELTHSQILYEQDYSLACRAELPGLTPSLSKHFSCRVSPRVPVPDPVLACSTSPCLPIAIPHIERTSFAFRFAWSLRLEDILEDILVSPLQSVQLWHVEWNAVFFVRQAEACAVGTAKSLFFVRCKRLHSVRKVYLRGDMYRTRSYYIFLFESLRVHFFALMSPIIISKLFPSGCKSMYSSSTPCRAPRPHPVRSGIVRSKP